MTKNHSTGDTVTALFCHELDFSSVNLSVTMHNYVKKVGFICVGISKTYLQHSDIQYVLLCAGMSLYAGMCRYVQVCGMGQSKNTCTYMQYMHIQTYLHIHAIHAHTCNTCTYRNTFTYMQYMHIHAIHAHIDIHAHTCNTCKYMQYMHIMTYMHIHAIHANTCNTCPYMHTSTYILIHAYTYIYMQYVEVSACIGKYVHVYKMYV